jgi:hypothetical protein
MFLLWKPVYSTYSLSVFSQNKQFWIVATTYFFYHASKGDGRNNGNNTQYRKKTVCVGSTERTVVVSIVHYFLVCLCCVVPVSTHYRLCLVTVRMKIPQNGRLVRFSRRTDCWCTFSLSICNQTDTLFLYQRSSSNVMKAYTNHG